MIKFKLYNKKGFTPLEILKNKLLTGQDTNKRSKFLTGFTLIELMVAMAIFVVVSIVSVSIFLTAIQNQRRDFQVQNLQDNGRYIIEVFTKEVRMLQEIKNDTTNSRLHIKNQDGDSVTYEFKGDGYLRRDNQPINSSAVSLQGKFFVVQAGEQQRVTIVMTLSPNGMSEPQIKVQNTVTVRIY